MPAHVRFQGFGAPGGLDAWQRLSVCLILHRQKQQSQPEGQEGDLLMRESAMTAEEDTLPTMTLQLSLIEQPLAFNIQVEN